MSNWISVKEALPEKGKPVLIFGYEFEPDIERTYYPKSGMAVCFYQGGEYATDWLPDFVGAYTWDFDLTWITHWQDLPNPPA